MARAQADPVSEQARGDSNYLAFGSFVDLKPALRNPVDEAFE